MGLQRVGHNWATFIFTFFGPQSFRHIVFTIRDSYTISHHHWSMNGPLFPHSYRHKFVDWFINWSTLIMFHTFIIQWIHEKKVLKDINFNYCVTHISLQSPRPWKILTPTGVRPFWGVQSREDKKKTETFSELVLLFFILFTQLWEYNFS